jgi:K+-transporting ATPase ATPase A chain
MMQDERQGWAIFAVMGILLMIGVTTVYFGRRLTGILHSLSIPPRALLRRAATWRARRSALASLAVLGYSLSILGWTALAAAVPQGLAGIANSRPHGFSEILYAFASATGNNGSSFAGLTTNTLFYNMVLVAAMAIGRFVYVIPLLAVAGSLTQKKRIAPSAGSVPTYSPHFVGLLVGLVLIMGGLAYFPAVSLGPVTEQVAMNRGIHYPAP